MIARVCKPDCCLAYVFRLHFTGFMPTAMVLICLWAKYKMFVLTYESLNVLVSRFLKVCLHQMKLSGGRSTVAYQATKKELVGWKVREGLYRVITPVIECLLKESETIY